MLEAANKTQCKLHTNKPLFLQHYSGISHHLVLYVLPESPWEPTRAVLLKRNRSILHSVHASRHEMWHIEAHTGTHKHTQWCIIIMKNGKCRTLRLHLISVCVCVCVYVGGKNSDLHKTFGLIYGATIKIFSIRYIERYNLSISWISSANTYNTSICVSSAKLFFPSFKQKQVCNVVRFKQQLKKTNNLQTFRLFPS